MSARHTTKRPGPETPRGRADLSHLRQVSDAEIQRRSPRELRDLPADFWESAVVVEPKAKQPISLRVDADVLEWFRAQGPRYQSRMNAVLRSYMTQRRKTG